MANQEQGGPAGRELDEARKRIAELEARTAELEALFDGVLGHLPVILFRLDSEGVFTDSRGRGLGRLRLVDRQVVGLNALEMFPQARRSLEDAIAGGASVFETRGEHPDGARWCFLTHTFFDRAAGGGAVGFAIDISERAAAEEELRHREAELRTLLTLSPDYVLRLDRHGIVRFINRTVEGVPADRILGVDIVELAASAHRPRLRDVLHDVRQRGECRDCELSGRFAGGEEAKFLLRTSPITEESEIEGVVVVATDVTAQREAEEREAQMLSKLQQGQKLESLGLLAGGIAHDFNNLLMGILGNASLALGEVEPDGPGVRHLHDIEEASKRAAELCQQLLAYSGKGRFVVRSVDLAEVVESTTRLLEVSVPKTIHLVYECPPGMGAVEADVTQLRQIIMNLVMNAAEAIGDRRGTIAIRTGVIECDARYLADTLLDDDLVPGRYCFLEVSDDGQGMEATVRQRLFDPFYTTKKTGRGLGMAAVLGIVRGHQGAIKVYSEPGQGTTMKVLLPCSDRPAQQLDSLDVPEESLRGSGTVLVVDDEPIVRKVATEVLRTAGFDVRAAEDGESAIEMFRAAPGKVAVVLLDLTMPRMSGEEVFRELRKIDPDVRVVLSSGYNAQDTTRRFAGKGLAGFIQKPYSARELQRVVIEAIARRGTSV